MSDKSARLELIIGPMFSGKSTELIRKIRQLKVIGKSVLVVKPVIDSRYISNKLTSHSFETADCIVIDKLGEVSNDEIIKYDTVIIDEGQFFPDLKEYVLKWISENSLNIIVGGLDGDFKRNPIGQILDLIPYSDKCIKLNALCTICKDGTEAPFTFRKVESEDTVLVGGSEYYIPVCRHHYESLKK